MLSIFGISPEKSTGSSAPHIFVIVLCVGTTVGASKNRADSSNVSISYGFDSPSIYSSQSNESSPDCVLEEVGTFASCAASNL
jgi:hypothetical protein